MMGITYQWNSGVAHFVLQMPDLKEARSKTAFLQPSEAWLCFHTSIFDCLLIYPSRYRSASTSSPDSCNTGLIGLGQLEIRRAQVFYDMSGEKKKYNCNFHWPHIKDLNHWNYDGVHLLQNLGMKTPYAVSWRVAKSEGYVDFFMTHLL